MLHFGLHECTERLAVEDSAKKFAHAINLRVARISGLRYAMHDDGRSLQGMVEGLV